MIQRIAQRLPFFYGWLIVAVVFVTMALGVNARTAFSLLFPPILDEFKWDRGATAGAFSFGFMVSAIITPILGRIMDKSGPLLVMEAGVLMAAAGMLLAPLATEPWHLYLTLGVLVGAGSVCTGYTGQSLFLPNWFARRRGLAVSIAFAGVGVGSIVLLPLMQRMIETGGWRSACLALGAVILVLLVPLNLLVRRHPRDLGLQPDGDAQPGASGAPGAPARRVTIVDAQWAAVDWTLARAARTARFWWLGTAFFGGLWTWYAVQVHQTKYLVEIGFDATQAAWALGWVSLAGVPGQIALGALSDRWGREIVWSIGCFGFCITYALLLVMDTTPSMPLLMAMVLAQGALGYGLTSVMGAIPLEIFEGKHVGAIFGMLMLGGIAGGAVGPWFTGWTYDLTGSYATGFAVALGFAVLSIAAIWQASPGKVRAVAGRNANAAQA
ncbi:MAG: MFS transporter [Betaproteobacteria bacterium]|nr:MFS transporter [Betaproteobacteria bacterium]